MISASVLHARGGDPRAVTRILPVLALSALGGCFATRNDVRVVQTDVASLRMEMVRADAAQAESLKVVQRLLHAASDSLTRVSARTVAIQGDVRGESRQIREQLLQIQSLLGQSQVNILRLRQELERAAPMTPPPAAVPPGTVPPPGGTATPPVDTAAASQGPGPAQLLVNGQDLLRAGSASTARLAFQELLTKFPDSDLAPDAQFFIGESFVRERNPSAADAAYAAVVAKYPDSKRAPTALYKRADVLIGQRNIAQARPLLQQVIDRYPKSVEAELAADRLASLK